MKIKICGITRAEEAALLNTAEIDYAGFVFYASSRRNVTYTQAAAVMDCLDPGIHRVAVTVSPDYMQLERIQELGFDVLQIHGSLHPEMLETIRIPVWYAINIAESAQLQEQIKVISGLPKALQSKIDGIVADGAEYGGGKAFNWDEDRNWRTGDLLLNHKFILAGGLNAENVQTGIRMFTPDIVDVSSGVEGENGKDEAKLKAFIRKVREYE